MMIIIKYFKSFGKLTLFLVVFLVFSTYLNEILKRQKIHKLNFWMNTYNPFNAPYLNRNLKYVLIWTRKMVHNDKKWEPLKEKQVSFIENKCQYDNCYATEDENFLGSDHSQFDAILINGKYISEDVNVELPKKRSINQLYVYAMKESADNYPICNSKYDNYFNLTYTYKLNSDVTWPYLHVYNRDGKEVGPRTNMIWRSEFDPVDDNDKKILTEKKYAAAWFVSNCYTRSRRESLFYDIKTELLKKYKLQVETVGICGSTECPLEKDAECVQNLNKYYFYFSFENSRSEDYVTEKLLKAVLTQTVPVVFGGANYSRFLPPHSYIDASQFDAKETAATMAYLIHNHTAYLEYFRWRHHYYYKPSSTSVCGLCEILNRSAEPRRTYKKLRYWWRPSYKEVCQSRAKKLSEFFNSSMMIESFEGELIYRKIFKPRENKIKDLQMGKSLFGQLKIDFLKRRILDTNNKQ